MVKGSGKRVIWMTIIAMNGWALWRWVKHGEAPFRRICGTMTLGVFLLLLSELNDDLAAALAILVGLSVAIGNVGTTEQKQISANPNANPVPPTPPNGRRPGTVYIS